MAIVAINVSTLPLADRIVKGQAIINNSTNNPNVPGNTAVLASFSSAQTALVAANAAVEDARIKLKGAMDARDVAITTWNTAIGVLAAFTGSATGGVAAKITTTGFDVRAEPAPPQPVGQVTDVRVSFNGTPGYSEVRWNRDAQADAYLVQCSPEPITDASWKNMGTVTEAKYTGNGATPGQKCWYRIAGVNRLGQGPWSEPALRPVM